MKLTLKVENMEQEETWEAFYSLNDHRTSSTMSEPPVYFTRSSSVTSIQVSPSGTVIDRTRERETKAKLKNNKT